MPAPPNTTPATAVDIGVDAFPYQQLVDVTDAPEGLTNVPACVGNAFNAVWYKFTPTDEFVRVMVYVNGNIGAGSDPGYTPSVSVWTGTVDALTQLTIVTPGSTFEFCQQLDGGFFFRLPVTTATTYWFQVVHDGGGTGPTPSILEFNLQQPPSVEAPIGAVVISDDSDTFPAAIFDADTGDYLQFPAFPAGESTDTQPTGEICTQNGETDAGVTFLAADFSVVLEYDTSPRLVDAIKSDRNGFFYVQTSSAGPGRREVIKFTAAGVVVWTKTLTVDFDNASVSKAVSLDGSRWYAVGSGDGVDMHVFNFDTDTQEADLPVGVVGERFRGTGDGYMALDGSLVFMKMFAGLTDVKVVRYDATSGAVLQTYNPASATFGQHFCFVDDDPGSFLVWGYIQPFTNNNAVFERIRLSDGAILSTVLNVKVSSTSNYAGSANHPDEISNSCPVFVLQVALAPPVPPPQPVEVVEAIRRLRRFPLPWDRSLWMYLSRIEFVIQSGVGLSPNVPAQGNDPLFEVRFSPDGGVTWGNWIYVHAGKQGEYQLRQVINRIGKFRNGLCEIAMSDPVYWYLIDCLIDVEESAG